MRDSNLADHLCAFLKEDWKGFRTFTRAHIKNGSDLDILIDHIYKYNINLNQPQLDTDYISKKLYKGKSRKTVLNLYSQATTLVKDYLIQDELSRDDYFRQIFLLKAYNRRLLYSKADKLHQQTSTRLKNEKLGFWPALYQQLLDHHYHFSNDRKAPKSKPQLILQSAIDHIELYHNQARALYKFETTNNLSNNKTYYATISDNYKFDGYPSTEISHLFNQLSILRKKKSDTVASELYGYFHSNHTNLSDLIRVIMYIMLRMHFARKANLGDLSVVPKVFALHKLMADNNYFINEAKLSSTSFMNIVELSAFLSEGDWAKKFIENNINHISFQKRHHVQTLSMAFMAYAVKNYEGVLNLLSTCYPKDIILKLMMNRLLLITHIEMNPGNFYFLKQRIENFRLFIYRNKKNVSIKTLKASNNLAKILKMIVEKKDIDVIEKALKSTEYLNYRYYLTKKIEKQKRLMN